MYYYPPILLTMDMKVTVFVVLCFSLTFGEEKKNGTPRSHHDSPEPTPNDKVKQDIMKLPKDPLMKVKGFEHMAKNIALHLERDRPIETNDVIVTTHEIDLNYLTDSKFTTISDSRSGSRFQIPASRIKMTPQGKSAQKLTVVAAWWKNVSSFPAPDIGLLPQNASALTVTYFLDLNEVNGSRESLPVNYYIDIANDFSEITSLMPRERLHGIKRTCVWLDLSTNQWNESGCVAVYNEREVYCACDHTTTFATLLLLDKNEEPVYEAQVATLVFEITSIVCLLITILFICVARRGAGIGTTSAPQATGVKANRMNSQLSLCFSVLCMHAVIVVSDLARHQSDQGCVAVTVLTHYFLLASAFWSFCEGLGIFAKVCPPLTMKVRYRKMTVIQIVIGWMVPFLITTFTAVYGILRGTYMDEAFAYSARQNRSSLLNDTFAETPRYEECWLSKTSGIVWAALGPLIVIVAVNSVILCYVSKQVIKMNRTYPCRDVELSDCHSSGCQSNTIRRGTTPTIVETPSAETPFDAAPPSETMGVFVAHRRRAKYLASITRSFGVLMPVLAIPWILSILANIPGASSVLSIAHAVVNGLQGFQIFLLYCAVNKKDWGVVRRKWRNCEMARFFSKYTHNRKDSVSINQSRTTYETKRQPRVDSNGNAYLHAGWKSPENTHQYDTLSSCRSSSGTIGSAQSRQSLLKKPSKWWRKR